MLWVGLHGCLRDPRTRRSYRIQRSLFNGVNLGTVDKVCILFLLPHVVGHEAKILPQNVREDLLHSISIAQRMIIAVRGNRSYTERELHRIFDDGYVSLFRHLERINSISTEAIFTKKMNKHLRNPDTHKAPKRFKRKKRYPNYIRKHPFSKAIEFPFSHIIKHWFWKLQLTRFWMLLNTGFQKR